MIYELKNADKAAPLFEGWEETMIWSCLQNVMGKIYGDDPENPASAMAILGDFTFFAGKPNEELVGFKPAWCSRDFMIMVPQHQEWEPLIERLYQEKARRGVRYSIKKEPEIFDRERLKRAADSLPEGYALSLIDEKIYHQCLEHIWSRDLVSQYENYEQYRKLGLGVAALKNGEVVAGASSYSSYCSGIEIEIDTREDQRRKGLAFSCSARLILECLDRNLYPSWDAQNLRSAALAEKLGYHFDHEYVIYEIIGY